MESAAVPALQPPEPHPKAASRPVPIVELLLLFPELLPC